MRQQEKQYRAVLRRLSELGGKRGTKTRALLDAALTNVDGRSGTAPGSIGWMLTTRMLDNPEATDFCKWCYISCYGDDKLPCAMPCGVPGCPYENGKPRDREQIEAQRLEYEEMITRKFGKDPYEHREETTDD